MRRSTVLSLPPQLVFPGWSQPKWGTFSGLYYKHVTIINDNSSIVSKWSFKLSDDPRVIIYNHHGFIIQATGVPLQGSLLALPRNKDYSCIEQLSPVYTNSSASNFCHVRLILPGSPSGFARLSDWFWYRNFPISPSNFVQCDVFQSDAYEIEWTAWPNWPDSKNQTDFGCFV